MQKSHCLIRYLHVKKRFWLLNRASLILMLIASTLFSFALSVPVYAQSVAPDPFACYGIADEYNGSGAADGLALINRLDGTAQVIGSGTGTGGIEALAFVPTEVDGVVQQVMFAVADPTNPNTVSSNTLGTVDLTTGVWSPLAGTIGSGTGPDGTTFDFSNSGDIDGLTWDVQRAILWATQRNTGDGNPDYLLQLDPATGQIVPDAFGPGIDWVPVPIADLSVVPDWNIDGDAYDDMDDLAVDPVSGRMFVILNKGGSGGGFVEINPADGTVLNYIGLFNGTTSADGLVDDMEGLTFFNDGQLYGSTGNNGPDPADLNQLFTIDIDTGAATLIGAFPAITRDIEALGCLTAPAFITLEKATNTVDADQPTGPNILIDGAVTWTYVIENTGAVPLLNMTLTDDILGDISNSCAEGALPDPFNAGETFTCTVSGTATTVGQYANLGTVDADFEAPAEGGVVTIPLSAQDPSHYFGLSPAISIIKTAGDAVDGEIYTASGPGPVTFTYVVENMGNTFLSDITISDDAGTADDPSDDVLLTSAECAGLAGPLAPTATVICTADIIVSGNATNVATTTGNPTDENGTDLPDVGDPVADDPAEVAVPQPAIEIIKTAGDAADGETFTISAPGIVPFIYTVTNSGSTYLSDITITDDVGTADISDDVLLTSAECADLAGPLAPGNSILCMANIFVSGDTVNVAGTTGNPTDADGIDLPGVPDPIDNDPADVVYVPGTPGISIVKTAGDAEDGGVYTAPGPGPVTFTYVVENTGETHLIDIVITDDAGTADDASDDVTITSAECADLAGPLAPGASVTCTAEIVVSDDATNVAAVTGTPSDPGGNPLPGVEPPIADDPADVVVPEAGIQIIKTAGSAADGEVLTIGAPQLVTFNYDVTNTGGTYLSDISISDDAGTPDDTSDDLLLTSADCADLAGPLAPGDSVICTADILVDGSVTNVAETTGTPTDADGNPLPGVEPPTDDDPAEVAYAPGTPGIQIIKTAGSATNGAVYNIETPGLVLFTYMVKNTGGTYLTDITISDDAGTAADESDDVTVTSAECIGLAGPIAPGDSVLCTAEIRVNGDAVNNANTTGTPSDEGGNPLPNVEPPTDTDDAEVVIPGSIGDTVWMDTDGDGIQTPDEMGIPGVTIILTLPDGSTTTTITDENGMYLFLDLVAGEYSVAVDPSTLPSGLEQTYDADGLETGSESTLTLAPGENNLDQDFGYLLLGPGIQLEKTVYAEHNSGADCPGSELESGANQPITYCFEVSNIGDTYLIDIEINDADLGITQEDMTILSGEEPLAPGAQLIFYYETELEEDLINTADVTGTPSDADGNPIPGLPRPTDQDIAQVKTVASLGNYIWFDRDADGSQDSSESGLEGVTVYLLDVEGNRVETTTTDENGFYLFDNLVPGEYAIEVETPIDGYIVSPMDNFDDSFDSDIDPATGRTVITVLDPNESDNTIDAGFTAPPRLEIEKQAREDVTQPGSGIIYEITYSNSGVGDAAGVVITEVVPRDTYFLPQASTPGWRCEAGSTQAGTICSFEIGFLPAGTVDAGMLIFAVQTNNDIPAATSVINNQVVISEDGTNGPQIEGQTVDEFTVEIQRPTALNVDFEPGIGSGSEDRVFLPFVGRRLRPDGNPYTLTVDQRVMSWVCTFMDSFGWTSDACFVSLK